MKTSMILRSLMYGGAVGFSVFLLFFLISTVWIGYEVKRNCQDARREYGGDCVQALLAVLTDENKGYRVRNSAIWSLGQLGDSRALPMLRKYYTGKIPAREPLDSTISQYELKKAVNLAGGGHNPVAIFWRNFK